SGISPDGDLVEMVEMSDHPWFLATQFHPELKSRPNHPHPLFASFIEAAMARRDLAGDGDATAVADRAASSAPRRWHESPNSSPGAGDSFLSPVPAFSRMMR